MDLSDLQREAHAIAKAKGWWDEERTFGELIALVHSELSEALEAYRVCGIVDCPHEHTEGAGAASELADVVIRVADMAEWYGCQVADTIPTKVYVNQRADLTFGEWIALLHHCFSEALEARWRGRSPTTQDYDGWWDWTCQAYRWILKMAAHYGIDLDAAIEAKMEYNRSRSYRHGGKAL